MATMIIAQQSTGGLIISSSSTGTQGPPGPAVTPGTAGQFYVTNAAATAPEWKSLSGDVTDSAGTTGQVTVTGLQGAITLSGAAANGDVLTATSSSAAHWAAPTSGITQLTGDVTAGPASGSVAATVVKINGASVPAAGALTTGNGLYVSGASALTYSALNLAGGAGYVTGLLPAADIAPGTNTYILTTTGGVAGWAAPAASGITALTGQVTASGSGSVAATITPGTAGQIAVSNATPNFAWTSLISYETTHGRFQSGGGGTDFLAVIGPMVGAETTLAGLWLLANGVAAASNNYALESDGTHLFVNAKGASGSVFFGQADSLTLGALKTSNFYLGGTTGAAPIVCDYTTTTTPLIQSGTNVTSLTVGTNKTGASLVLSADANVKNLALLENSGTVNEADFYAPDGTHKINVLVGNNGSATIGTLTSTAGLILQAGNAATALTLGNPSGTLLSSTFNSYRISRFITKGSNYTIDSAGSGDEQIWMTAAATITLPNPAGLAGRVLEIIVNYDPAVGGGTIARNGSENINGAASNITLVTGDKYSVLQIRCNGTDWVIKGGLSI